MINLLPLIEQKRNQRVYRERLMVVALFLLASVLLAGSALLVPSYVLTADRLRLAEVEMSNRGGDEPVAVENPAEIIAALNTTIAGIRAFEGESQFVSVIEAISGARLGGEISIDAFSFERAPEGTVVVITGIAATRDSLIRFAQELKRLPLLTGVALPVSNLTESKNNPFTIRAFVGLQASSTPEASLQTP